MNKLRLRWHVYSDLNQLIEVVANGIVSEAARAISATGRFLVVLAGGSTPRPIYARLVELDTPWNRWHIYFGDERCLSAGHPERNDTMIREVWLDKVSIPVDQIHAVPAELGPDAGAKSYAHELACLGPFDLTIPGLGKDGHTASLFPGSPLGCQLGAPDVLAVHAAPKPPASRISMSAARLTRSQSVQLIVTGEEKRAALTRLRDGADMPIRSVNPANGIDLSIDSTASPTAIV